MKKNKQLSASQENYLKAIYSIVIEKQAARVKDISKYLNIGPSSVSEALKSLAEKKLINYEPYGIITLTPEGKLIVQDLIERHEIIKNFLSNVLAVDDEAAQENANKIEHATSEEVLTKFVRFLHFAQICPCKEPKWMRGFQAYCEKGEVNEKCQICMSYCKEKGITKPILGKSKNRCCGETD